MGSSSVLVETVKVGKISWVDLVVDRTLTVDSMPDVDVNVADVLVSAVRYQRICNAILS